MNLNNTWLYKSVILDKTPYANTNTRITLIILNLYRTRNTTQPLGLLFIFILTVSFWCNTVFKQQDQVLAQQYIQTIKHRNLVIHLDGGVKTSAQITLPGIGKGPFSGVLLIPGSGVADKNGTVGFVHKDEIKPSTPLL